MITNIEPSWKDLLKGEFEKPYFQKLTDFVEHEYKTTTVFPPKELLFNAFNQCPFNATKVVIIGQDPYHDVNQAHGLCFSVNEGVKVPPSLRNIYKEQHQDMGLPIPESGNLERWAKQGVLMINATLTVRAHQAGSHQRKGWEEFTDAAIRLLAENSEGIVFLLWGNYAQKKASMIDEDKHFILKSVHPSPLSASRGFYGNHHFSRTNAYLIEQGKEAIQW